jgi:hypothetical protein
MIQRMLIRSAMCVVTLGVFLFATGAGAETPSTQTAAISKQLAVMSRIIEKRLGDELKDQVITASMVQRGIQGFYVRGVGALFFIDVKFPVAQPPAETSATKTAKPGDLWDRYEREVEGRAASDVGSDEALTLLQESTSVGYYTYGTPIARFAGARASFDKTKVERLKATLFEVLAEYGRRIEALSDNERIVIVICGAGEGTPYGMYASTFSLASKTVTAMSGKEDIRKTEDQRKAIVERQEAEKASMEPAWPTTRRFDRADHGSVLTVSVERKGLAGDAKDLAGRAKVDAYCY